MTSGFDRRYNPNLNAWYRCNGQCPNINTYAYFRTFNVRNQYGEIEEVIRKVPIIPSWKRYSILINASKYYTGGQSLKYSDRPLNEYGYWAGAPSGYGQPPRNQFN
jgi:hypothetical protein